MLRIKRIAFYQINSMTVMPIILVLFGNHYTKANAILLFLAQSIIVRTLVVNYAIAQHSQSPLCHLHGNLKENFQQLLHGGSKSGFRVI